MQLDPIHTIVTLVDHLITLLKILLIKTSNNKIQTIATQNNLITLDQIPKAKARTTIDKQLP